MATVAVYPPVMASSIVSMMPKASPDRIGPSAGVTHKILRGISTTLDTDAIVNGLGVQLQ